MNIHELVEKIKYIGLIMLFAAMIGGFWRYHTIQAAHKPISINKRPQTASQIAESSKVYASKTGHSYYYLFCGALKRIKPDKRLEFATAALARARGYVPAKNCKGVQ